MLAQAVMELEVAQHVGAARHARTPERSGQRNGYRERAWDTRVGTLELRVPQVRDGGTSPRPRPRTGRAPARCGAAVEPELNALRDVSRRAFNCPRRASISVSQVVSESAF